MSAEPVTLADYNFCVSREPDGSVSILLAAEAFQVEDGGMGVLRLIAFDAAELGRAILAAAGDTA